MLGGIGVMREFSGKFRYVPFLRTGQGIAVFSVNATIEHVSLGTAALTQLFDLRKK